LSQRKSNRKQTEFIKPSACYRFVANKCVYQSHC
jgi:hypothetical protein